MSSTWFKSVSALKVQIPLREGSEYKYDNYILIVETAESNVTNYNGGHDYHKWIYTCGEYDEVMRDVFSGAISFDNGSSKWKPNHKDSCGFIRVCKKALESAKDATEIPYDIKGYIFLVSKTFSNIVPMFENVEGIQKIKFWDDDALITKDIKTYIVNRRKIQNIIRDYKESLTSKESFDKWIEENKGDYFK